MASALSLYVAIEFNEYWHILLGAAVAPFLLLRTKASEKLGLRMYEKTLLRLEPLMISDGTEERELMDKQTTLFGRYLFYSGIACSSFLIRGWATLKMVIRQPITALRSINQNWYKQCFEVSLKTPFEPVPGAKEYPKFVVQPDRPPARSFRVRVLRLVEELLGWLLSLVGVTLAVIVFVAISFLLYYVSDYVFESYKYVDSHWSLLINLSFLVVVVVLLQGALKTAKETVLSAPEVLVQMPAVLYRWALKSTFLVWAPLLWVLNPLPIKEQNGEEILDEIRYGVANKTICFYSAIVLLAFAAKVIFVNALNSNPNLLPDPILNTVVVDLYLWHFAALINAVLAIGMLLLADTVIRRIKFRPEYDPNTFVKALMFSMSVRRFLSVYIIANSFQILVALTGAMDNIKLHGQLFALGSG